MRAAWFGVCAMLTACNAAFGLDPTISVDAAFIDFDRDGVTDSSDNCATVANADQLDGDGDGFGDACDTCPTVASVSTHDEDEDGLGDACDLCPGIADFGDDLDGDGVGDVCDPDKDKPGNVRLAFEPFVTIPPEWQAGGVTWTSVGDAIAPAAKLPPTDGGLANTLISTPPPWFATIGYASSKPWTIDDTAGIEVKFGTHVIRCDAESGIVANGYGQIFVDGSPYSFNSPVHPRPFSRITLRVSPTQLGCAWDQASTQSLSPFPIDMPATFSLISSPAVHVTYFEILQ